MSRAGAAVLLVAAIAARPGLAQQLPSVRGYYLNVGLWSDSTDLSVGGFDDLQRLRLMTEPKRGPFSLEVAYEHLFDYSQRQRTQLSDALLIGAAPSGGEWLDLQWTIESSSHVFWRHRFDRLNLSYAPGELFQLRVGRQTISWATALLLTPADPFAPFEPSDPFREFRGGVDAVRAQVFPGPFSEAEIVVRPSETLVGETLTVLARGQTLLAAWEVAGWAGMLHDEPAASAGAAGALGAVALRGEASLRKEEDELVLRATVGVDTRLSAMHRDLYVLVEYQHDGFGAGSDDELVDVLTSDPFLRGEMQVLSQDVAAAQASYQVHPLWTTNMLVMWSLNDGSALLVTGASYSLSNEATAQAGLFLGLGDDTLTPELDQISEFGIVSTTGFLSISVFF